jgi:hypothetical protein
MATTNDHDSPPINHTVPDAPTPCPPSPVEAKYFYYGIPSKPRLVARSSTNPWVEPRGPEAYLIPKETSPLGFHSLEEKWEAMVGPAIVGYLDAMKVAWTSLDPVRMGEADDPSPAAIVWIGVLPGSLTAELGVEVAVHCKGILSTHGIDDLNIEIRESEVFRSAKMYRPVLTSNATAQVLEPFSTALGLPISTEDDPSIGGTGGFFIFDPRYPDAIFLVTARHVVIRLDKNNNELYQHSNASQPRKKVLLFSDPAVEKHITAIESELSGKEWIIKHFERRLEATEQMGEEDGQAERDNVEPQLKKARKAIGVLRTFLSDVSRDWKEKKDRVLGHVVLSPPIGFNVGEKGFTEDWAVVQVDKSKIDAANFIGNAVDLGTTIGVSKFTTWMRPHPANPPSFEYPVDRLLKFYGTIPDDEMWKGSPRTLDHENDAVIMVIKNGHASGLTVGRLNTIRSFTRYYFKGEAGQMSKEVTVLPRNSESGAFSKPGDSGSAVIDGKGRLAGLLTGGAGVMDRSDCTYVTSINFLRERMLLHGLKADFFPSFDA